MTQRMTLLGALAGASLLLGSAAHAAPLNPECKSQLDEVRVWNGTDHVIQVAVEKLSPFTGSDAYYDVKPNEVRCWSRPGGRTVAVWYKDGDQKRREWSSAGGVFIETYTSYGMELRPYSWTPPPPAPVYLNPKLICTSNDPTQFRITNMAPYEISLALLNIETAPKVGAALQFWSIKPYESRCWPQPPVAKPTMIIKSGDTQKTFTSYPRENPWIYTADGKITKEGATPPAGVSRWAQVAGPPGATLKQISVGSANAIWGLDTGGFPWKWNGSAWEKKAGTVSTLSVTADGTVWATNPPDSLRVLKLDVANNKWTWNIPTGMKQVTAVNATTAYGLDDSGSLFKLNGASWEKQGCCVSQISIGSDGELWATNPPDTQRVLRWDGSKWTWAIPAGMTYVSVGNAKNIWALDESGQIFKWSGSTWDKKPGALVNISAANDGTVWGINAQGTVYKWVP